MTVRALYGSLFVILALALGVCALFARFSRKSHNESAALLLAALIPPVVGNMMITFTADRIVATAGCMIYFPQLPGPVLFLVMLICWLVKSFIISPFKK